MEPDQNIGSSEFGVVWWVITLSVAFWAIGWIVFHYWHPSKADAEGRDRSSHKKRRHRHRGREGHLEMEEIVSRPEAPRQREG